MRWGSLEETFVWPVHWLVLLYGDAVSPLRLFGLDAGRETRGHRFHHPGRIYLSTPAAYAPLLETEGRVMADFSARREAVRAQVMEAAVAAAAEAGDRRGVARRSDGDGRMADGGARRF